MHCISAHDTTWLQKHSMGKKNRLAEAAEKDTGQQKQEAPIERGSTGSVQKAATREQHHSKKRRKRRGTHDNLCRTVEKMARLHRAKVFFTVKFSRASHRAAITPYNLYTFSDPDIRSVLEKRKDRKLSLQHFVYEFYKDVWDDACDTHEFVSAVETTMLDGDGFRA